VDPEFSAFYRNLYEQHWWFRMRERWLLEVLCRTCPPEGWNSILDVGCGDALFFDRLLEFGDVEGVEPNESIVNSSGPHFPKIRIGPFDGSFCPGKQYSLILLLDVLEHLPDANRALQQCMSLLKPGGSILLTVPAFNFLWTNHDVINHHQTRYRRGTLFPLLRQAGFRIEESAYWFHWPFPIKLAERLVERTFRIQPGTPSIPPPLINQALFRLCSAEHYLFAPLRLPFGTTLFVHCKKPIASAS
jgi:SAM-dependent methyltransferase